MIPKVCRDQVHYEPQNQCAPPVQCTARVRELLGMIDSPKRLDCDRKCGEFGLSLGISCEKKEKRYSRPQTIQLLTTCILNLVTSKNPLTRDSLPLKHRSIAIRMRLVRPRVKGDYARAV